VEGWKGRLTRHRVSRPSHYTTSRHKNCYQTVTPPFLVPGNNSANAIFLIVQCQCCRTQPLALLGTCPCRFLGFGPSGRHPQCLCILVFGLRPSVPPTPPWTTSSSASPPQVPPPTRPPLPPGGTLTSSPQSARQPTRVGRDGASSAPPSPQGRRWCGSAARSASRPPPNPSPSPPAPRPCPRAEPTPPKPPIPRGKAVSITPPLPGRAKFGCD